MNKKTVLVTGSGNGLGKAIARTLVQQGMTVFATMRDIEGRNAAIVTDLKAFAEAQGSKLYAIDLDVTNEASVQSAIQEALRLEGRIDVLINNAGIGGSGLTEAFSTKQLQETFDVNVFGVQRLMRSALPSMRKQGYGLIINISSAMGRVVIPFAGAYTASKFALEALVESYRYELAPTGIDIVAVEPGGFASGYWSNMMVPTDRETTRSYGQHAEIANQLWTGISTLMQSEQAPDPKVVVDAIWNLIETPLGQRPFRTVVDPVTGGGGPTAINQTSEQVQTQLLAAFGLKDLLSVKLP